MKYRVLVTRTESVEVHVEADSEEAAKKAAFDEAILISADEIQPAWETDRITTDILC